MTTALDVAAYILEKRGQMTAMKLQKLVYYAQAWSMVWDEEPLFADRIEGTSTTDGRQTPWIAVRSHPRP